MQGPSSKPRATVGARKSVSLVLKLTRETCGHVLGHRLSRTVALFAA